MRRWSLAVLFLAVVVLIEVPTPGGSGAAGGRGYEVLRPDLEPFRSAFDAAADDVRAVLLVGPT